MYLELRGKCRFHFTNSKMSRSFFKVIVVSSHQIRIWSAKNFKLPKILRRDRDRDVVCWGEKSEIKSLEDILFDIIFIDCAKVIESLYMFEFLTNIWFEISRDTHNSEIDSLLDWSFIYNLLLIFEATIFHICEHNYSILAVDAFILFQKVVQ